MEREKKLRIGYWVAATPILFIMGFGGVYDIIRPPEVLEVMRHLGYPDYFAPMLGGAKVLGIAALLHPRTVTLKEWAYAGFTFNLLAASPAHFFAGDPPFAMIFPLVFLVPLFASRYCDAELRKA